MKQNKCKARYNLFPEIAAWIQKESTGYADDVLFFSCKVCKTGKLV